MTALGSAWATFAWSNKASRQQQFLLWPVFSDGNVGMQLFSPSCFPLGTVFGKTAAVVPFQQTLQQPYSRLMRKAVEISGCAQAIPLFPPSEIVASLPRSPFCTPPPPLLILPFSISLSLYLSLPTLSSSSPSFLCFMPGLDPRQR